MRLQIQPLFKKKFSPINTPADSISANIAETSKQTINDVNPNSEIKQLYNEKLGIIKDLISFCTKYEQSHSMRARFTKILNLSKQLEVLISQSTTQIDSEINFHSKLANSLEKVKNFVLPEETPSFSKEIDENAIKICSNISGVNCIAFVTFNRSMTHFFINLYGSIDRLVYSYHLNLSIKPKTSYMLSNINEEIVNNLYFCMFEDNLILRYDQNKRDLEYLVLNTKGRQSKTCVTIKENQESFELGFKGAFINVPKTDLNLKSLNDLKLSGKKYLVRKIIETRLSFVNDKLA